MKRRCLILLLAGLIAGVVEAGDPRDFPARLISPAAGTIQVAVRLKEAPAGTALPLASVGGNDPTWWLLSVTGREVAWLMENRGKLNLPGTYYLRLAHELPAPPAGELLDVAVTWERQASGVAKVVLYVNGRSAAVREDTVLAPSLGKAQVVGIGWNTANASAPRLDGQVVGAIVTGRALSAAEIAENDRRLRAGEPMTANDAAGEATAIGQP